MKPSLFEVAEKIDMALSDLEGLSAIGADESSIDAKYKEIHGIVESAITSCEKQTREEQKKIDAEIVQKRSLHLDEILPNFPRGVKAEGLHQWLFSVLKERANAILKGGSG